MWNKIHVKRNSTPPGVVKRVPLHPPNYIRGYSHSTALQSNYALITSGSREVEHLGYGLSFHYLCLVSRGTQCRNNGINSRIRFYSEHTIGVSEVDGPVAFAGGFVEGCGDFPDTYRTFNVCFELKHFF